MIRRICSYLVATVSLLLVSFPAAADCTLGHKSCRKGSLWVCERCGSETCWIYKGTRCVREDDTHSLPLKTGKPAEQTRQTVLGQPATAGVGRDLDHPARLGIEGGR